jgi:ElaA protein
MTDQVPIQSHSMTKPDFQVKSFSELTALELKAIYQLRQQVFIIEQDCPYPDIDEADLSAQHIYHGDKYSMDAYARIVTDAHGDYHVGRVVVAIDKRQHGLGQALMQAAIKCCQDNNNRQIIISAQSYLANFYRALGFQETGDYYLEDNIPHMRMILPPA